MAIHDPATPAPVSDARLGGAPVLRLVTELPRSSRTAAEAPAAPVPALAVVGPSGLDARVDHDVDPDLDHDVAPGRGDGRLRLVLDAPTERRRARRSARKRPRDLGWGWSAPRWRR